VTEEAVRSLTDAARRIGVGGMHAAASPQRVGAVLAEKTIRGRYAARL